MKFFVFTAPQKIKKEIMALLPQRRMPKLKVKHQQQLINLSLSKLKFNQVAIKDKQILHPCGTQRATGQAGPEHHHEHSTHRRCLAKTIKYPLKMVPHLSFFARTWADLMVRRSGSSSCTSG